MGDFLMALLGSLLAFWVRFNTLQHVGHFTELELRQYVGHLMLGSVSLVAVLAWMGIYRRSMLLQPRKVNRLMLKGCLGWSAGFLLLVLTFQISPPISRIYMALNGVITFGLLLAWRLYFGARLHEPARWAVLQQRAILVGTGEDSAHLKQQFERSPESAIQVMGWVAADPAETSVASSVPCLGTVDRLDEILSEHAHHALETEHLSHLLCATDNDYYNALTCKAQGAEFGHHRTFQLATHLEAGGGNKRLPLQQRGYSAFSPSATFEQLHHWLQEGWSMQTSKLTETFSFKQLQQRLGTQGEQWLLIGGISPRGNLWLATKGNGIACRYNRGH